MINEWVPGQETPEQSGSPLPSRASGSESESGTGSGYSGQTSSLDQTSLIQPDTNEPNTQQEQTSAVTTSASTTIIPDSGGPASPSQARRRTRFNSMVKNLDDVENPRSRVRQHDGPTEQGEEGGEDGEEDGEDGEEEGVKGNGKGAEEETDIKETVGEFKISATTKSRRQRPGPITKASEDHRLEKQAVQEKQLEELGDKSEAHKEKQDSEPNTRQNSPSLDPSPALHLLDGPPLEVVTTQPVEPTVLPPPDRPRSPTMTTAAFSLVRVHTSRASAAKLLSRSKKDEPIGDDLKGGGAKDGETKEEGIKKEGTIEELKRIESTNEESKKLKLKKEEERYARLQDPEKALDQDNHDGIIQPRLGVLSSLMQLYKVQAEEAAELAEKAMEQISVDPAFNVEKAELSLKFGEPVAVEISPEDDGAETGGESEPETITPEDSEMNKKKKKKSWYRNTSANSSKTAFGELLRSSTATLLGSSGVPGKYVKRLTGKDKDKHLSETPSIVKFSNEKKLSEHISVLLARQFYVRHLCRCLMLYGAPTHRLEEYMRVTCNILDVGASFLYLPGCMVISFDDQATHTSDVYIVREKQGIELDKLRDVFEVFREVVLASITVEKGITKLDDIKKRPKRWSNWQLVIVYGFASAFVGPFAFQARGIDMPIIFILGCLLGFMQLIVAPRSEDFSNIVDTFSAIILSAAARGIGTILDGSVFCFSALAQSSIALILPGYIILCGALELQTKSLIAGSVRMFYAIVYSLFLGFGITIGSTLFGMFTGTAISATTCNMDHRSAMPPYLNFLFVFFFTLCLMIINQAKWDRHAFMMVIISMTGYTTSFFSAKRIGSNPQVANGLAAFAIGLIGNAYSRFGGGLSFAAMLPGIFVQVPSGLAAQGSIISGISNANRIITNTTEDVSKIDNTVLALGFSMMQVAVGITVGLFISSLFIYPAGRPAKRRYTDFSF